VVGNAERLSDSIACGSTPEDGKTLAFAEVRRRAGTVRQWLGLRFAWAASLRMVRCRLV